MEAGGLRFAKAYRGLIYRKALCVVNKVDILETGVAHFSVSLQTVNILGFGGQIVFITTTQLCHK